MKVCVQQNIPILNINRPSTFRSADKNDLNLRPFGSVDNYIGNRDDGGWIHPLQKITGKFNAILASNGKGDAMGMGRAANAVRIAFCVCVALTAALVGGCSKDAPKYGVEKPLFLPASKAQVWAIAPAVNLSGQRQVDPLLQADLLYQQLQQVNGLTVVPVNRVIDVYWAMKIEKVQSEEQANQVCELLGCDGLMVPTVTAYDPYNPPKFGAALQLFLKSKKNMSSPGDAPRSLGSPLLPPKPAFFQSVGVFDAANGSVREATLAYAQGRNDPLGPYAANEYFVNMDRFCGFVYHELIKDILNSPQFSR